MLFSLAATLPIVATFTTAQASGFAPSLLASFPARSLPDWQAAQAEADRLHTEARRARAALEASFGPRGLTLGTLTLPNGRTVPIRAASPDSAKKLWRRLHLGPDLESERGGVMKAVKMACDRWDVEAERTGLRELEQRAVAARDRAKALMARASREPIKASSAA